MNEIIQKEKINLVFVILILSFILFLGIGEHTGAYNISDYDGAPTGITSKQFETNTYSILSDVPFTILYQSSDRTLNVGEKLYYSFAVFEKSSNSKEREYYNLIDNDNWCNAYQEILDTRTYSVIHTSDKIDTFTKKYSGAVGNYYQLSDTFWVTQYTPMKVQIKTYITCGFAQKTNIDSSEFIEFIDIPEIDPDKPFKDCDLKDTQYCSDGELITKDYTYTGSVCQSKTTTQANTKCYDEFVRQKCESSGGRYDAIVKICRSTNPQPSQEPSPIPYIPPAPKTCDGVSIGTFKCIGDVEKLCTETGWQETGSNVCLSTPPITCGTYPEQTVKCFGDVDAQCIGGTWIELNTDTCKSQPSIISNNLIVIVGIVIISAIAVFILIFLLIRKIYR